MVVWLYPVGPVTNTVRLSGLTGTGLASLRAGHGRCERTADLPAGIERAAGGASRVGRDAVEQQPVTGGTTGGTSGGPVPATELGQDREGPCLAGV